MKNIFFLLLSCFALGATAQEKIETDRPDQTETPYLVPKGWFQGELGLQAEWDGPWMHLYHPTALLKYGISKRVELRLITELLTYETPLFIPTGNEVVTGLAPLQLGAKIGFWEQKGILPKTSLIFHTAIPATASRKMRPSRWAPNFRFVMQNAVTDKFTLSYNAGAEWNGESKTPSWLYTIAPSLRLSERWSGYVEAFGFMGKYRRPEHSIDIGFAFLLSNNLQLDASAAKGLSSGAPDYITLGFSFRFD
ncbi:MAG TPA: transporter [Flavisolibacter sp.]|jgi:hypothetical protein